MSFESLQSDREIPFARPLIGDEERNAVVDVLSGNILTHGPKCSAFEERFANLVGVRHAVATSSCTTAMHLSLLALGIGPGDEVIVPAETHVATAHVVEHCGARPVFVDVERQTGNIDVGKMTARISDRTRAILVVHYLGLPCRMDEIRKLADKHGLRVIEDCALAVGARFGSQHAGSFGDTGCFSFYPTKHITTMEGGMLVTDDDGIAADVRKRRAFGYDRSLGERRVPGIYDVDMLGYNFRMSEGQAAVGLAQLDRLDGFLRQRRQNSDTLNRYIADIDELLTFPVTEGPAESSRFCVNVLLSAERSNERNQLIAALNAKGVGTSVHYPVALPLSKYYQEKYNYRADQFPVAGWISNCAISLPCGPHLGVNDMEYIGRILLETMASGK